MIAIGERFLVKAGEFPLFDRTHRDFKAARKDRTPFAGGAIDEDLHERILELFSEAHAWLDADR